MRSEKGGFGEGLVGRAGAGELCCGVRGSVVEWVMRRSPRMKRLVAIAAVLFVLVSLIGFERMRRAWRFVIFDDRVAGVREGGEAGRLEGATMSSGGRMRSSLMDSGAGGRGSVEGMANSVGGGQVEGRSVAVRVGGEVSPIHFVRASAIFGDLEPSKEQIARLKWAAGVVGDGLRPGAVIINLDGEGISGAPVLLDARVEFDVTAGVRAVYDSLEEMDTQTGEGEIGGEQRMAEEFAADVLVR